MAIFITNRKGHQSIRATGKDAQALFAAMCKSVEKQDAGKTSANALDAAPNTPKDKGQGPCSNESQNGSALLEG